MKLFFKLSIVLLIFSGCKSNRESTEFVRLESELVQDLEQLDSIYFTNQYKGLEEYGFFKDQSQFSDSIIDIFETYDRLIFNTDKSNYLHEISLIQQKIDRRKKYHHYRWNRYPDDDTTIIFKNNISIDFQKYTQRITLSKQLRYMSPGFQRGCVSYFQPINKIPFYEYKKIGNKVIGQFRIGHCIFFKEDSIILTLKGDKTTSQPLCRSKNDFINKAIFVPNDTGNHEIMFTTNLYDPITGKDTTYKKSRTIYVKP